MIALFPPAALITISQGAVKGDLTYPIKRSLEDGVLFLVALNPTTKAYFAVALANRRYEEAETLLAKGAGAQDTIDELVKQTQVAANDINSISSANKRAQLIADLSSSIQKYDQGLAQAQQQLAAKTGVAVPESTTTSSSISTTTSTTTSNSGYTVLPVANNGAISPQERQEQQSSSGLEPMAMQPANQRDSQQNQIINQSPSNLEAIKQQDAIEKARRELEELRSKLEAEQKLLQQQSNIQPTPTPLPSPSPQNEIRHREEVRRREEEGRGVLESKKEEKHGRNLEEDSKSGDED